MQHAFTNRNHPHNLYIRYHTPNARCCVDGEAEAVKTLHLELTKADITIARFYRARQTLGELITKSGWRCLTLELPWLGNNNDASCIREGLYPYRKAPSPRLNGRIVIWIDDVPDRDLIQLHPGNYTSDLLGCGATGDGIRDINNDGIWDVTNSVNTFDALLSKIPDTGFIRFTNSPKPGIGVYK